MKINSNKYVPSILLRDSTANRKDFPGVGTLKPTKKSKTPYRQAGQEGELWPQPCLEHTGPLEGALGAKQRHLRAWRPLGGGLAPALQAEGGSPARTGKALVRIIA